MKKYLFFAALLCGTSFASMAKEKSMANKYTVVKTNACATVRACGATGVACGDNTQDLAEAVYYLTHTLCGG